MKLSKKIALTGICTAFASICLIFGNTLPLLDYSLFMLGGICTVIPLITGEVKWSFISAIVATIIGLIFVPNIVVMYSFFIFFAPHSLITGICQMKKVKNIIAYPIKAVFFAAAIMLMYFFTTLFVEINQWNLPLAVLFVVAFFAMMGYDFLMQRIIFNVQKLAYRLMKRM